MNFVGFGDEAIIAALRMSNIGSEILLVGSKPRIGGDPVLFEELRNEENVKIYERARPLEIIGDENGVNTLLFKQIDLCKVARRKLYNSQHH